MQKKSVARALGIAVAAGAAWLASAQVAPPPSACAEYVGASQWDTSVSFNYAHVAQDSNGKADLSADANGRALLTRLPDPFPGITIPSWNGLAQGSGFVHDIITDFTTPPPDNFTRVDGTGGIQPVANSNATIVFLDIDPFACTYRFTWTPSIDLLLTTANGTTGFLTPQAIGSVQSAPRALPPVIPNQPLPPLTGSASFVAGFAGTSDQYVPENLALGLLQIPGTALASNPGAASVTWSFDPNVEEVELVVEPKNGSTTYDQWLPEGSRGPVLFHYAPVTPADRLENRKGNELFIEAKVRRVADGLPPTTQAVQKIDFAMTQRSFEPGIALNMPPAASLASPQPPDFKFDATQNLGLGILVDPTDSARATAQLLGTGRFSATAELTAYDWGAFGTLEVTATLASGKVLVGHLITNPAIDKIPIPYRVPGSDIGEQWRIDQSVVGKADSEDDEDNPGGTGVDLGDGYSLYEEYRGFFQGGSHRRGTRDELDPTRKDLFIINDSGLAAAKLGFKMLEDGANGPRMRIHADLLAIEYAADRIMNFNFGQGFHTVDQHAIRLKQRAEPGGLLVSTNPGVRRVPRFVLWAEVGPTGDLSEDARTVAHEIAHGISVMHHGDSDAGSVRWTLVAGSVIEQALDDNGQPTGPLDSVEVRRELGCGGAGCVMSASELAAIGLVNDGDSISPYLANLQGQHSGHQFCFMRYETTNAYTHEPRSSPGVRWWVGYGTDVAGPLMDTSSLGTGTNDTTRDPRSRSGDACATAERGACRKQVRVSDKLNPLTYPGATVCP